MIRFVLNFLACVGALTVPAAVMVFLFLAFGGNP